MTSHTMPTQYNSRVHPKKFALWLGLASIVMMFAGLTSAYIVRRAAGNWVEYKIPEIFTTSTVLIFLSSIVFHLAYIFLKKENKVAYRVGLFVSLLLGIAFSISQVIGWNQLTSYGIRLTGNPSGSFLYLISGIHLVHLAFGILVLFVLLVKSFFKKDPVNELIQQVNPGRYLGIELALTYWHFVDILWIYLFFFFSSYSL